MTSSQNSYRELISEMRDWAKDCHWSDIEDDNSVDELSDADIVRGVAGNYSGGILQFLMESIEPAAPLISTMTTWLEQNKGNEKFPASLNDSFAVLKAIEESYDGGTKAFLLSEIRHN